MNILALAALATVVSVTLSSAPSGHSIVVTRFDDPAPNACLPNDCSLREALILANSVGWITIELGPGAYDLEIGGRNEEDGLEGDLNIKRDLEIRGAGAQQTLVYGPVQDRVFRVHEGAQVSMSDFTIAEVHSTLGEFGVPRCGGGIWNQGELTLERMRVESNTWRGHGAAVCNEGMLDGADVSLVGNQSAFTGRGGGLYNTGTANIQDVVIHNNSAEVLDGGGIYNIGNLVVERGEITANSVFPFGSLHGAGVYSNGSLALLNITVAGNTVSISNNLEGGDGRGAGLALSGDATLENVTVADNQTPATGGGIYAEQGANVTLTNTIIAGNVAGNCEAVDTSCGGVFRGVTGTNNDGGDCEGTVTSAGHNIDGDGSCGLDGPGDLPATDPMLGPLADNGGSTMTHALLEGSPAIDAGDDLMCPETDQRGAPRPAGEACDIGAYEAGAEAPEPTPTPPPTATPEPGLQGDADCNEKVDALDALAALRFVAGFQPFAGCLLLANVDCSLSVDAIDALLTLRWIAALPVAIPPGCPPIGPP